MTWEQLFDLPCGCKRHPAPAKVGTVLIQRWEDLCAEHKARKYPEGQQSAVQRHLQEQVLIQEELQDMARERLKAKGKI